MRIQLGAGNVIFVPSTTGNPATPSTPRMPGSFQDFTFDNSGTMKELRSQNQYPDDTGMTDKKATWKMGSGRFDIDLFNNLFAGETQSTGGEAIVIQESHTIPATNPYTITVTHAMNFAVDMGVSYAVTGQPLQRVASLPAQGQYSYVLATGVYTFAAADTGLGVAISYSYTVTTGTIVTVHNQIIGFSPQFSIYAVESYQELTASVPNYLKLYACKCTKFGLPFKRADYLICDLEGEAFANSSIPAKVYDLYED